jgi:diketogulonate reductase-like aldo/keto reductase
MFSSYRNETPVLLKDPAILRVAARAGKNVGQVLLKWALRKRPRSSVLPKSANPERLKGNLDLFDWDLTDEDMRSIDTIETRARMVDGSFWVHHKGPYVSLEHLWDE